MVEDAEEFEDIEDIEEDELARWALFRGMNIRATSSAFMALRPPWLTLALHADRLVCWKLGGFATAVIRYVCKVFHLRTMYEGMRDDSVGEGLWNAPRRDLPRATQHHDLGASLESSSCQSNIQQTICNLLCDGI